MHPCRADSQGTKVRGFMEIMREIVPSCSSEEVTFYRSSIFSPVAAVVGSCLVTLTANQIKSIYSNLVGIRDAAVYEIIVNRQHPSQ